MAEQHTFDPSGAILDLGLRVEQIERTVWVSILLSTALAIGCGLLGFYLGRRS